MFAERVFEISKQNFKRIKSYENSKTSILVKSTMSDTEIKKFKNRIKKSDEIHSLQFE